jgi:hypothetical protein
VEEPSLAVSKAGTDRQLIMCNIAVRQLIVATALGTGRVQHSLEGIWRPHYCDLPLEQVVIVHQASREAVHWPLRKLCRVTPCASLQI